MVCQSTAEVYTFNIQYLLKIICLFMVLVSHYMSLIKQMNMRSVMQHDLTNPYGDLELCN